MNYKLCLCLVGKEKYETIDISRFFDDKKQSFNLEKIDAFTMNFNNENELKQFLYSKGLISEKDLYKPLSIFFGSNDIREVPIIYSTDKETIDKIRDFSSDIKQYFDLKKRNAYSTFSYAQIVGDYLGITDCFDSFSVMAKNIKFLRALQEYCSSNPKQSLNISDINLYINENSGYTKSRLIYIALFELFRRLFYKYDENKKELNFNYKGFRDFCVFYCKYKSNVYEEKTKRLQNPSLIANNGYSRKR